MGSDVLKKFGRYFLLDQMAQGGMAEIYRARLASVDGAGRLLVIKRVQAGYGDNREFLQMFKSEIKVTMGLNHPNIVQLYDFGEENGQPFIAMEFVDGKNLRQFNTRAQELKQFIPVEISAYLIEQAAAGLHYAHNFKDKLTGKPLNIVHRDISPQNILVSYEGTVKIIDFGIAKATTNLEATRVNVIKGKPSYLSPEQITGEELDGRSDVFSLGTVLWEILTGKKLFAGENDRAILMLIESSQSHIKAPSTVNPAVPKELDQIVLKSLAKSRDKRFQSAEEFQRALHKFLYSYLPEFNPSDLSYYSKDLFASEIVEDRKKMHKLNEEAEKLLSTKPFELVASSPVLQGNVLENEVREDPTVRHTRGVALDISNRIKKEIQVSPEIQLKKAANAGKRLRKVEPNLLDQERNPKSRLKGKRSWVWAALWVALIGTTGVIYAPEVEKQIPEFQTALNSTLNWVRSEKWIALLQKSSRVERSPGNVAASAQPVLPKMFPLRLNLIPPGGKPVIAVGGKPIDSQNPVLTVTLDSPLELVVKRDGFRDLRREFFVESAQVSGLTEYVMDVQMEPVRFGFLSIHTTPSADAIILFEGKPWVKRTPFEREKVPVGTYTIKLVNELLGMEKTIVTTVGEGKVIPIDERLEIKN